MNAIGCNKNGIYSLIFLSSGLYFLLCFLILPENLAQKSIVILALPVVLVLFSICTKRISTPELIKLCTIVLLASVAVFPAFFSSYNQRFTFGIWLYLLISAILFGMNSDMESACDIDDKWRLVYCWTSLAVLFFYSFIHTDYSQGDLAFGAYNNDKNYAALIVFLMFMIYMKLNFWPGIAYPLIFFAFCNKSRGLVLCVLVFCGIRIGKRAFKRIIKPRKGYTICFLVVSTIAIICFSYLFMYSSAFSVMGGYRESLVDTSNKMRFNANIYAVDLIRDNNLIWSGYGNDLTVFIGVFDGIANNMVDIQYNGFRLVQSHNSVINNITRIGIVPSFLYFFVLGLIADRYKTYDNLEYYYTFLIYGLILNYYYGPWIVAWLFILFLKPVKGKRCGYKPLLKIKYRQQC